MKKIVILGIGASMFFLGSCVESSQKYKSLQARLDSLSTVHIMQNSEMESMLADLNDISAGMQSLRDAEELIQELMLFIWENRNSLFVEISLKSYLFMAVKHRCLNAIKRQLYHERVHSLIYDKIKDQFENPDTYFVNELTENITKAIEELPENYRETFKLSRFGEQSNPQIAEALGVSIKTVEYRITQSLKILRVKLKDYLPFIMFLF